ncbi:peptide-methionine (S)-S-oxide reductase MsrA [Candidatus Saccharibacteria bacterium]|nr:peptide-methionine (S)-S-oxide reductase MsrA [Candidatus Saccharibacteria bacterium]
MKPEKALFAAGCFWGVQYYFDHVPGVSKTTAGYSGGKTVNPSYEDVLSRTTGHAEAVEIEFNPAKVSYETLVKHFFRLHDPTALNAADGINIGDNYRSALYYLSDKQKKSAEKVRAEIQKMYDRPIVTEFKPAGKFYPAEGYHQKFTERTGRGACHIGYAPLASQQKN